VPEFFQRDRALCAFSIGNDAFRYAVIHVPRETGLASAEPFQPSLRGASALRLELCAEAATAIPDASQLGAAVADAVGVGCDVGDSEINAYDIFSGRIWRLDLHADGHVNLTALDADARLLGMTEKCAVTGTAGKWHLQVRSDRRKARGVIFKAKPRGAERDGAEAAESRRSGFVQLIGVGDFGDSRAGSAGTQPVYLTSAEVDQVVQREPAEDLRQPRLTADPIAAIVDAPNEVEQAHARLSVGHQLESHRHSLHSKEENTNG
jgi:hypothetical protein